MILFSAKEDIIRVINCPISDCSITSDCPINPVNLMQFSTSHIVGNAYAQTWELFKTSECFVNEPSFILCSEEINSVKRMNARLSFPRYFVIYASAMMYKIHTLTVAYNESFNCYILKFLAWPTSYMA